MLQKIKGPLISFVPEGVRIVDEHAKDAERALEAVGVSRAVLFLLSSGTLSSTEQMRAIVGVMASADEANGPDAAGPFVVLMTLPGFEFPTDEYYSGTLPATLGLPSCEGETSVAEEKVRSFFKKIAVHFPTGAADNLLENQAAEVVSRLKKRRTSFLSNQSPSSSSVTKKLVV